MLHITEETANLIALEENLDLKNLAHEYCLQTGAKLYPPNLQRLIGWRIIGYSNADVFYYIERYEVE